MAIGIEVKMFNFIIELIRRMSFFNKKGLVYIPIDRK